LLKQDRLDPQNVGHIAGLGSPVTTQEERRYAPLSQTPGKVNGSAVAEDQIEQGQSGVRSCSHTSAAALLENATAA